MKFEFNRMGWKGEAAKEVTGADEPSAVIGLQLANNRMSIRASKQARNSIATGDRRHHSHQQPNWKSLVSQ